MENGVADGEFAVEVHIEKFRGARENDKNELVGEKVSHFADFLGEDLLDVEILFWMLEIRSWKFGINFGILKFSR